MEPKVGSELTPAEELTLKRMCVEDMTYQQIAELNKEPQNTVSNRANRIRTKLGVRTTPAAAYKWSRSQPRERMPLPDVRQSITHKFTIYSEMSGDMDVYLTVGLRPHGQIGELWVNIGKQGSTTRGALDAWARMVSVGLQWGIPIDDIIQKFSGAAFEPAGRTSNPKIPTCTSILDYVVQWLARHQAGQENTT